MCRKFNTLSLLILIIILPITLKADSSYLYGIHWYGNTGSTDVESMTGGKGIWDLEITLVDTTQSNIWDQPDWIRDNIAAPVSAKGHSFVFRVQPNWSRNVPNIADPYTKNRYASDCQMMANSLKNYVHIWQIGNEVNLDGENMKWNGSSYATSWQPDPTEYATTYLYCRDSIHNITPTTSPATQIVLMQPVSPGNVISGTRFMDGNEYLWRQIEALSDKSKIDGFGLHGYAEPGGSNYGVDGFWDSIREQLMIIDEMGLGNRPVYITEWNKHMPDAANANIGAKFLSRALSTIKTWNSSTDGEWPGQPNHNIAGATWFVYPAGTGWDAYSLAYWKTQIASTDPELNPWYSFQSTANFGYPKGANGGGPTVSSTSLWWEDDFNGGTLDSSGPLPSWKPEVTGTGSVVMNGSGAVRFLGNGGVDGGGGIRTSGYVFGNFHTEIDFTFTNSSRSNTGDAEANVDIRIREGSKGYSITFFPGSSGVKANQIQLRRTNDWTQIGSFLATVPGGINTGDNFHLSITANGSNLTYIVYKNGNLTPVVNWSVSDSGQKVGWLRLMSWNLNEAQINKVQMGGPLWNPGFPASAVKVWDVFD